MEFRLKVKLTNQVEDLVSGTHLPIRFQEVIKNVKYMGFDALRFSISWSRVIPSGRRCEGVNQEVIDFYNDVIEEIKANGLKHFVMIFHWDTPQALEDKYGGILNSNIVNDYRDYADLLFETFGDQVQYWMTFNEPWALSEFAYDDGLIAPAYDYDGNLIGEPAYAPLFYIFPKGINNNNNETQHIAEALKDRFKIDYYRKHMWKVLESLITPLISKVTLHGLNWTILNGMLVILQDLAYTMYTTKIG
ncbi:hypothetical protein GH714_015415 [Hevea brasiliensis]|uniref:Uncharacterized protein n=1 Tax=Hevea brasiliensis TaxID=3981 RepID=A0A6A6N482_HEVBR|nr:hypothetical protein GH714_015415 [Hevea brasiliensis]